MILALRTDQPQAEIYLFGRGDEILAKKIWLADRQLSQQLLGEITKLLKGHNNKLADLDGILVFRGPGSFTGLRIGIATANALAYGLGIPIVGSSGQNWLEEGLKQIPMAKLGEYVVPDYAALSNITPPRK